jgi:hypothetical protein
VNPRFLRGGIDLLSVGKADFFIDFVERKAGRQSFSLGQVDAHIMMVDELLGHALSRAEIATARRRTQQQSDKKKSALCTYHSFPL